MNKKINLPEVALGAWSWGSGAAGGDQVFGNHLSEKELKPVYEKAMELGLNLWDTAAVYGEGSSEQILGGFVEKTPRDEVVISTKFTPQIADGTEDAMQHMIDGSKQRLRTEVIDIYWIHNSMDVKKWTPKLVSLMQTGQILSIGVSNHNLNEIKQANEILNVHGLKVSAVQNHFSLLHRSSEEAGILKYCKDNGITFYSYMVLEQGALSGQYGADRPFPEGSARAAAYNASLDKLEVLVNEMNNLGKKYEAIPAQIATAWAIQKGTLPIVGVTKVKHVEDAAKAIKIKLDQEEIKNLEFLAKQVKIATLREWEKEMA